MVINNDCLFEMQKMSPDSVDMIYLDPPFFSQQTQKLKNSEGKEFSFDDTWATRQDYLDYMKKRLAEMHKILKSTGSIFLHCDTYASHYLRILLDEILGEKNFRSEIIWTYKRWSNSKKGLLPAHQTIFFYSKSDDFKFNFIYGDYSPTTNLDQILQERKRDENGKSVYKRDENGNVIQSKEKKGVPLSDVWEIPFLNPKAKERTGYPTQKPINLLERIISISTDENDLVLDPFCGSGTTLVAAKLLGRKFIGIDKNPEAVKLSENRLENPVKSESELLKKGKEKYLTKTQDEIEILSHFDCDIVQRNKGIDAFLKEYYQDSPVALKIQKSNETINEAICLLETAGKRKNCKLLVLILRNKNEIQFTDFPIPQNMILIKDYKAQAKFEIKKLLVS